MDCKVLIRVLIVYPVYKIIELLQGFGIDFVDLKHRPKRQGDVQGF